MPERYWPFDQDIKLGPRPWNSVDVRDWEEAHGHDIRMKCYPEFDCRVVEASYEHRIKVLQRGLARRIAAIERGRKIRQQSEAQRDHARQQRDQARAAIQRVRELAGDVHQSGYRWHGKECHKEHIACLAMHVMAATTAANRQALAADELSRLGQQQADGLNPLVRETPIRVDHHACRIMWGPGCATYHGHECHHGDGHDGPHTCPCGATANNGAQTGGEGE